MPAYDANRFAPPAPVAVVTLRHPESREIISGVSLLIDSGADATLLPKAAVESLGIAGTGEHYQLTTFDGTTSESEAVHVDLLFLSKRFRGRFLVVDAETGILGRNILNHVRLRLDGPSLRWEESRVS